MCSTGLYFSNLAFQKNEWIRNYKNLSRGFWQLLIPWIPSDIHLGILDYALKKYSSPDIPRRNRLLIHIRIFPEIFFSDFSTTIFRNSSLSSYADSHIYISPRIPSRFAFEFFTGIFFRILLWYLCKISFDFFPRIFLKTPPEYILGYLQKNLGYFQNLDWKYFKE